mmetsp:Transcript_25829/g.79444  ORF Transcript_25829/g.79444 Transcript_25829/m.79444 type:complete len:385 (+) Transcript_25829:320-1474(+)
MEQSTSSAAADGSALARGEGNPTASKKEIYTHDADWTIYAMGWSQREEPDRGFRLALGSFVEEYANKVSIIQRRDAYEKAVGSGVSRDRTAAALARSQGKRPEDAAFVQVGEFEHPYPATKILWSPDKTSKKDLLATTGDYLRVWSVPDQREASDAEAANVEMVALLNNNKNSEYCAPLTSFDWNDTDPTIVGTSSIDTTCTIWDLAVPQVKTQLIAHDKEVYDIAFARGKDIFASVGADGSVRLFDLRTLEHSTIIFETASLRPLLRLAWNKQDPNYLAAILADDPQTIILDVRVPSIPVAELGAHQASVNSIAWAPHSSCHLCTCSDDCQALIWDLTPLPKPIDDPILAYTADAEVNQLQWSTAHHEWVAIAYTNTVQALHV